MATDGVKIIDGDLARDVYDRIMELYDTDVSVTRISKEVPFCRTDYGSDSDFYHEIFVTAYALAFWEIGALTPEILDEVKQVIAKGAGVRVWTDEGGETEGRKRLRVLEKFVKKISLPNNKIRKRKRNQRVKNLCFQPNDVLTFRVADGGYRGVICAKVTQQRGECTYDLVATTFAAETKPQISEILASKIIGRRIECAYDVPTALSIQPGVDEIWKYCGVTRPFIFGLEYDLVSHRFMIEMKENFEKIGELAIRESFKTDGSYGSRSSFADFEEKFCDLDAHMSIWKSEAFPVKLLCFS